MAAGRFALGISAAPLAAAALVLFVAASQAGAAALASATINGATDSDSDAATATATASTDGPLATGGATASADVPTGTLRARTIGLSNAPIGSLDAVASAEIEEVLFVIPDEGSPATPVPFTIFMDLDGTLGFGGLGVPASPSLQTSSARASAGLGFSGLGLSGGVSPASFTVSRLVEAAAGIVQSDVTSVLLAQNTIGTAEDGLFDVRLTATATVTPNVAFTVRAVVTAESGADPGFSSIADMLDTARLGVVVPDGYGLVSSSGLFLTVPEPGGASAGALAALAASAALSRRARDARSRARGGRRRS